MTDDELCALLPLGEDGASVEVPGIGTVRRRKQDRGIMGTHITWGEVVLDLPSGFYRTLRPAQSMPMPDARMFSLKREYEETGRIRQRNAANRLPAEAVAAPKEWLEEQERRAAIVQKLGWHHTGMWWERRE